MVFDRTRRLDPLDAVLNKIFRRRTPRTLEEQVEAARRFLGVKKKVS